VIDSLPGIVTFEVDDPDQGDEILFTLPDPFQYELISLTFRFVTEAAGATRVPLLNVSDTSGILFRVPLGSTQIASKTFDRYVMPIGTTPVQTDGNHWTIPFPIGVKLLGSWDFSTTTTNKTANDQYSNIRATFMRWATPTS